MPNVPSSGWTVEVTHPTTSRTITPQVLSRPQFLPSLNSLPEIRIPVKPSASWLSDGFDDDPLMDVWLDGVKQPIDILTNVEDRAGETVLVGIGGTELRDRVQAEYRSEQRWIAARNLVQNETTYGDDFDTPNVTTQTDELLQNPTTSSEFTDLITIADTDPISADGDELELEQTSFTIDDAGFSSVNGATSVTDQDGYNEGTYHILDDVGEWLEIEFTNEYAMPKSDLDVWVRAHVPSSAESVTYTATIDGEETESDNTPGDTLEWQYLDTLGPDTGSGTLDPGTHTVRIEVDSVGSSGDESRLDIINISDNRYTYTFDNTLSATQGYVDGPELYPDELTITPNFELSAFSVTDVSATLTIDDTSGNQSVQVSNDFGETWKPDDGTQNNTASVDHSFASPGPAGQLRFTLNRYSPSGDRNDTPRTGYDTQTVSDWTLRADIDLELLLIDEKYDQALWQILNDIAGEDFVWSYNLDSNGDGQISWAEDGQRVATSDPDYSAVEIDKDSDTFDRVTIKGSPDGVSEETFTASTSFTSLENTEIVVGSETVYDASTNEQFTRGPDYEMDYADGEIRILTGGDMTDSSTYTLDYRAEISGTYPSDVSNPDREFVDSVPGIVSDRGAEQIAFVLYSDAKDPRWSGNVVVPNVTNDFNPLEALPLADRDLPSGATPLEPRGSPEITPEGVSIRLGSRPPISQAFGQIAERVSTLSNRS